MPKLEAFRVKDLFEIFQEEFGLRFRIGTPRPSEKIHEVMATSEEVPRMCWDHAGERGMYLISPTRAYNTVTFPSGQYSSKDHVVSKERLHEILRDNEYFRPRHV